MWRREVVWWVLFSIVGRFLNSILDQPGLLSQILGSSSLWDDETRGPDRPDSLSHSNDLSRQLRLQSHNLPTRVLRTPRWIPMKPPGETPSTRESRLPNRPPHFAPETAYGTKVTGSRKVPFSCPSKWDHKDDGLEFGKESRE